MAKSGEVREGEGQGVPATTVLAACREMMDAMSTFAAYTEIFGDRVGTSEEERTVVLDVRESISRLVRTVRQLQSVAQVAAAGDVSSGTFRTAPGCAPEESATEEGE